MNGNDILIITIIKSVLIFIIRLQITAEDLLITIPSNVEPLPEGGVQKRPSIVKSGSC